MNDIREAITKAVSCSTGIDSVTIGKLIENPPDPKFGDYSFPCFKLSKTIRKSPEVIAVNLSKTLTLPDMIERIENIGGYLNFFINRAEYAEKVLNHVTEAGLNFGASSVGNGKTVVIDYCSANIAKPFYFHHLPTTVIGDSLYKIFSFLGYKCIGINHIGDWGTQFGKLIVAYRKWGIEEEISKDPINELVRLYVRFHKEAETDNGLNEEARAVFKAIEDGEEEYVRLWRWFRELSIDEFKRVLDILKVKFDSWDGESFYNDKMDQVVDELREKKLLYESQGAQVVDLSDYGMPPCIILRNDGATLYATRDIAAAMFRKKTYDFDKVLYCVATQQNLHFRQVFKVIDKMGYGWADDLIHVANGMINLESGSMATRKGTAIYLEDVLKEAAEKALQKIEERNPDLTGKDEIAGIIGIGAVKFSVLKTRRIKDSVFSWDKVLNFEGETSCYIQYTYARICSVLRKAAGDGQAEPDYSQLSDDIAYDIVRQLSQFPKIVQNAADEYEPSVISKYLLDLVQAFNRFYNEFSILNCEDTAKKARIQLCRAVKAVIGAGMYLLGIDCPERM